MSRKCGFCGGDAPQTHDTDQHRLYECSACGADYLVSKGKSSWWYHGWEHTDGRRLVPEVVGYSHDTRPASLKPGWRKAKFFPATA